MLQKELKLYVPMLVKILTQKEKKVWKRASIKGKKKYNLCKRISQFNQKCLPNYRKECINGGIICPIVNLKRGRDINPQLPIIIVNASSYD